MRTGHMLLQFCRLFESLATSWVRALELVLPVCRFDVYVKVVRLRESLATVTFRTFISPAAMYSDIVLPQSAR